MGKGRGWLSSSSSSSQRDVINKCTWERSLINSLELNQKQKVQEATWHLALGRRTWPITRNFLFTRPRNGGRIPPHLTLFHSAPTLCYVSRFLYLYIRLLLSLSVACRTCIACLPACLCVCMCVALLLGPAVTCTILPNPAQSCPFLSTDESSSSQWPKNIMKLLTWSCNVPFDFVAQHSARSGQTAELYVCMASGLWRNRERGREGESASNSTASTTMSVKIRTAARQMGKWATHVDASLSQPVNPTISLSVYLSLSLSLSISLSLTLISSVSLALIVSADDVWKVYLLSKHHEMLTKYTKTADALNARVAAATRLTTATTWDRETEKERVRESKEMRARAIGGRFLEFDSDATGATAAASTASTALAIKCSNALPQQQQEQRQQEQQKQQQQLH